MFRMKTTIVSLFFFAAVNVFAANAQKEWTFLVFINGHNNLSSYADMNIIDMEKTGSTNDVNLLVEWGSTKTTKTKRLYVQKSTNPQKVTSPTVMEMDNHDMGDYRNLVSFIDWGVKNYPAKHYFVAVWNHGSGWNKTTLKPMDISFDDNTGNHITTEELGLAMSEAKKIIGHNVDIYGSDACLMQMIEVAGEMKDSVDYFVGSQDVEPGEGWPYAPFIKKWTDAPMSTPAQISVLLSKEYLAAYSGGVYGKRSVTFAAWDMSKLDGLYASIKELGQSLRNLTNDQVKQLKTTATNAMSFTYSEFVDLGDFVKRAKALTFGKDIAGIDKVTAGIKEVVLSTDNSSSFASATGLSIWIPTYSSSDQTRYDNLSFSKATQWNEVTRLISK